MSDVEKLKLYNDISSYLKEEDRNDLFNKLQISQNNLPSRLRGFQVEDELVMILDYLKCAQHIVLLDESSSFLTGSYQCDLLVQLKNNTKIFLEVKSKEDFYYKISGGNLDNRISFANDFGFPLLFAIKLNRFWILVNSDYLKNNNGKINLEKDFENSLFSSMFGSETFVFPKGIKVVSVYSKTDSTIEIQFPPHGNLVSYEFYFNDNLIFEINADNTKYLFYSTGLEILHDKMAKSNMEINRLDDDKTKIVEQLEANFFFNDYDAFLATLNHTLDHKNDRYNCTSLFNNILEDKSKKRFLQKENLSHIMNDLKKKGLPIVKTTIVPKNLL